MHLIKIVNVLVYAECAEEFILHIPTHPCARLK